MTPENAGSSWKERRESMGKTIDQVSADLRIGRRFLAGIEEGDFEDFPERVFSAGFIRSYAKYLSQDPEPVLAEYERRTGSHDEREMSAQLQFGWVERERQRGSRRATYTVAAGAVLLVGVILAWVSLRTEQRRVLRATGMTPGTIRQIERARRATALLQRGGAIADAAQEAGYFDQAHLTRSLRRFVGQTPAQVARGEAQLSLLYNTAAD
jgi:transcriptional regulator with XRE-family HTH domain